MPLGWGRLTPRNIPIPMCYHAKFDGARSTGMSTYGYPLEYLGLSRPAFKSYSTSSEPTRIAWLPVISY